MDGEVHYNADAQDYDHQRTEYLEN
ncbi:PDDEXK family nuclease [Psychroserpens burtonensis]|nr:hypothetical protein [Psychroserpens burtonensis]